LIVDFLAHQKQHVTVAPFGLGHPDVVVGDDHEIQAGLAGDEGNLVVGRRPI